MPGGWASWYNPDRDRTETRRRPTVQLANRPHVDRATVKAARRAARRNRRNR